VQYKNIKYEEYGQVCHICLKRPRSGNEIDRQMGREIADACRRINQDDHIIVVIISGAGGTFYSGSKMRNGEWGKEAAEAIASLDRIVIAAIDGDAFGEGLELALACDIRIASERARFCLPHVANGHIPSSGGTQRLPRIIGRGRALEMVLTSQIIDSREAFDIGLVAKVVPYDQLLKEAKELAKRISAQGPIALRYAKEAMNSGMDLTLSQGLRLEADLYFLIQTTDDRIEGIAAFREKRSPRFKGK